MTSNPLTSSVTCCYSPSSNDWERSVEEEEELAYTSQCPLLAISTSTSSDGSPCGCAHNVHPAGNSHLMQCFDSVSSSYINSEAESNKWNSTGEEPAQNTDIGKCLETCRGRIDDPQELFEGSAAPHHETDKWIGDDKIYGNVTGCCSSPTSDTKCSGEESELTYTSQRPLLELSSSTSSTDRSPLQCAQNLFTSGGSPPGKSLDWTVLTGGSSPSLFSEDESSNCDSPRLERTVESDKRIISSLKTTELEVHMDGSRFIYQYPPPSHEILEAVRNLRYPDELTQWALQYLSQLDSCTAHPVKKKKTE